ncbi:MAG: hypothetical protein RL558_12 [Bacteroidota bacterium]|jgi:hypothetical protein
MPKLPSHLTKEEMEYQQFVRSTVSNWVNSTPEFEKVVDLYQRIGPSWSINELPIRDQVELEQVVQDVSPDNLMSLSEFTDALHEK